MQWEVWDIESGNLVGWRELEHDALTLVRDLVKQGWPVEALSLTSDDDMVPAEALPSARTGVDLLHHAERVLGERRRTV